MEAQPKGSSLGALGLTLFLWLRPIASPHFPRESESGRDRKSHYGFYTERLMVDVFPQIATGQGNLWAQYARLALAT